MDCRDNRQVLEWLRSRNEQPITYEEGVALAKQIGAKYMEASALTQKGLKNLFDEVVRAVIPNSKDKKKKKTKQGKCTIM